MTQFKYKFTIPLCIVLAIILTLSISFFGSMAYRLGIEDDYTCQLIGDFGAIILSIVVIKILKIEKVFSFKFKNVGEGLICGLYFIILSFIVIFDEIFMYSHDKALPAPKIIIYILCMIMVGFAEEITSRGIVSRLLFEKYAGDKYGVYFATLISGLIFGGLHLINIFIPGTSPVGVFTQSVSAIAAGMAFTAIYYRSKSLYPGIIIHAIYDIAGLWSSGIYGEGSVEETISSYGIESIFSAIPLIIITVVLLRNSKIPIIIGERAKIFDAKSRTRYIILLVIVIVLIVFATFSIGILQIIEHISRIVE